MLEHLIVCRHGETEWNRERRTQGREDSPLTAAGIDQAAALGRALAARGVEHVVSSTLGRAMHTAEIVAGIVGCTVSVDARLVERAFGHLEGRQFGEIPLDETWTAIVRGIDPDVTAPGSESLREVGARMLAALHDCLSLPYRNVAVISHGHSLRGMLGALKESSDYAAYHHGNCGFAPLQVRDGVFSVEAWNVDPLAVDAADAMPVTNQK
ncbi:histidine phosphatase family protein [Bacillus sp. NP157]|nr:histidine phosphatase family protein [Bacillus sp. NP157]